MDNLLKLEIKYDWNNPKEIDNNKLFEEFTKHPLNGKLTIYRLLNIKRRKALKVLWNKCKEEKIKEEEKRKYESLNVKEFQTAGELYEWAKSEQLKAIEWCEKNFAKEVDNKHTIISYPFLMFKISGAYLENIKILDDETVREITGRKINLVNLVAFANAYEAVKFFVKSGLKVDGHYYREGLSLLKQNANELQRLSDGIIKFRIPMLPHEIIRAYADNQTRYKLDKKILQELTKQLSKIVNIDRKRKPSKTEATKDGLKEYGKKLLEAYEQNRKDGFKKDPIEISIELNRSLNYYTAKKQ